MQKCVKEFHWSLFESLFDPFTDSEVVEVNNWTALEVLESNRM